MQNKLLLPVILGVLVIGGASFYGGAYYANAKTASQRAARQGGAFLMRNGGQPGQGGRLGGQGFLTGQVVAKDANSITLKLRDGGSKVVFYSTSTTVGKIATGSIDDVATGKEIIVNGTANPDGSETATMLQVR